MYEQDIELARLLVEKLTMMQQRADKIREELSSAESELDRLKDVRSEREAYLEVLSRAAKLLDRSDLQLDSPESKEAEDSVARLRQQLGEVDSEVAEYGVIFEELRERAPKLIAALEQGSQSAGQSEEESAASAEESADEPAATEDAEPGEDSLSESLEESAEQVEALMQSEEDWFGDKDGEAPPLSEDEAAVVLAESAAETDSEDDGGRPDAGATDAVGEEVAQEVAVGSLNSSAQSQNGNGSYASSTAEASTADTVAVEAETPGAGAAVAAPAVLDRKQILQRFNLRNIRAKEAFTYGRNAIYILDTPSIISRIPNYDISLRKIQPLEVYQELLRDVDTLSREVSGSFYLIFDREFSSPLEISEEVFPVGVAGEGERTLEATRTEVRNIVNEQSGRQRSVCLVTADKSLAESVSGPGVHFVQLSDFFQT